MDLHPARSLLAIAAAGLLAAAALGPAGDVVELPPPGFATCSEPDLAVTSGGEVWMAFLAAGEGGDAVLVRRLEPAGSPAAPELLAAADDTCLRPRLVALPAGGLLAVWSARVGGEFDLHFRVARREPGGELAWEPAGRLSAPGAELGCELAAAPDGGVWLVYEAARGGGRGVFGRRFAGADWGPERALSGAPGPGVPSDGQPSVACAADGTVWVAWTSWRHARYADGDTEVYVRSLDGAGEPSSEPLRISRSTDADLAPCLAAVAGGVALFWTRAAVEGVALEGLRASAYDAWVDKRFVAAWHLSGAWSEPRELRTGARSGQPVHVDDEAFAIASPPGALDSPQSEVLLFYDELLRGGRREKAALELRMVRARPEGADLPVDVAAGRLGEVGAPALAWAGESLWIAEAARLPPQPGAALGAPELRGLRARKLARARLEAARAPVASLTRELPREPVPEELRAEIPDLAQVDRERPQLGGEPGLRAWFGNLHMHTHISRDGATKDGPPDWNLRAARDVAGLDFAALTDHSGAGMDPAEWRAELRLIELYDEPGRFVTLPGYEWSSPAFGHKNVIFRSAREAGQRHPLEPAGSDPATLFAELGERAAIAIPHHPSHGVVGGTDWSFRDDRHQRLVEIFQKRGSYEFDGAPLARGKIGSWKRFPGLSVRDALATGQRLGIIASPDHGGGLGLAGVWAGELTREAIFDALYARRCFGTTGAKLAVWLEVNGQPLGSEDVPAPGGAVAVLGRAFGTAAGLRLVLVAGGRELAVHEDAGDAAELRWNGVLGSGTGRHVYLRVEQSDGQRAWSSPVWLADGP